MKGTYSLYVFDLDGTLLDSSPGIINAVCYTLRLFKKTIPDNEILTSFIGPPLKKSFSLIPDVEDDKIDDMVRAFRDEYRKKEIFNAKLYDGIMPLCQRISDDGIKMAIATNKPEEFAQKLVKYFQLDKFIPVVCGADAQGSLKKTDLIKSAIFLSKENNIESVVMVGDTISDAEAAEQCGVDFIGVDYGFGNLKEQFIKNMVKLVEKPEDIYCLLDSYKS